jgi:hypothetical protein
MVGLTDSEQSMVFQAAAPASATEPPSKFGDLLA